MSDELKVERHGHVAVLTLNRPESLNAITMSMADAMREECDRMNDDPGVRAVVITGAGRGFCSGFDIKKGDLADPRRLAAYSVLDFAQHRLARLRTFAKPTIAAVNGVAVGGGLGLALACDIRICSTTAKRRKSTSPTQRCCQGSSTRTCTCAGTAAPARWSACPTSTTTTSPE